MNEKENERNAAEQTPARVPKKKKRSGNKKRLLAIIISVVLVVAILLTVLVVNLVRKRRPPELEQIRDRAISLIDASFAINEILFGKGLPTYPRIYENTDYVKVPNPKDNPDREKDEEATVYYFIFEDEANGVVIGYQYWVRYMPTEQADPDIPQYAYWDMENGGDLTGDFPTYRFAKRVDEQTEGEGAIWHSDEGKYSYYPIEFDAASLFFYDTDDEPYYDYVRRDSGYLSVEDIKERAAEIYSAAYLASVNESVFTGITVSNRDSGTLYPLYMNESDENDNLFLKKYNQYEGLELGTRVYDYSTMRIDKGDSNSTYVVLEIESWLEGKESERITVRVALALENGEWFLDSPTY